MKKLFLVAILLTMAFSAFAQKPKSKDDLYKEIGTLTATKKPEDMAKAYPLAKEFLEWFGKDDKDGKVKMFVTRYREHEFLVALDANKYDVAFPLGKEILAEEPDNVEVLLNLGYAGYTAASSGNRAFVDDSLGYARKTVQLMEAGTLPKTYVPFKDKDEATAFMYFAIGNLSLDKDKKEGVSNIYKAMQYESKIKTNSAAYFLIAAYYEDTYTTLATELKTKADGKKASDAELSALADRVSKTIDLMLDGYARAVKMAEGDKNPDAAQWKQRLAQIYKFVKKTDSGLTEYINQVAATPMPDPAKI
jgi:hypothetical protein